MHLALKYEQTFLLMYTQEGSFDGRKFFCRENPSIKIRHVGPWAQEVLCKLPPMITRMVDRSRFVENVPVEELVAQLQYLRSDMFLTTQDLLEILDGQILDASGSWNLIPMFHEEKRIFMGVSFFGDGWTFSRRLRGNNEDKNGDLVKAGDCLIFATIRP